MSTSSKIPVVVLEMMEKLRREQKGKDQTGTRSSKKVGQSSVGNDAQPSKTNIVGKTPKSNTVAQTVKAFVPAHMNQGASNFNSADISQAKVSAQIPNASAIVQANTMVPSQLSNTNMNSHAHNGQASQMLDPGQVVCPPARKLSRHTAPVLNPSSFQSPSFQVASPEIPKYQAPFSQPRYQSSVHGSKINLTYVDPRLGFPDSTSYSDIASFPDPPIEQLSLIPMSPPNYVSYHMNPMLPSFHESFQPHMHSHLCPQYHPCPMLPHPEYHCAQVPPYHVTPYGQQGCCMETTVPRLKRQPSYMQMPLSLKPPQQALPDFGESHSPVENLDNHLDLGVGSMVEVMVDGMPYYGVIRWLGQPYASHGDTVAGIEMEQEHEIFCDGQIQNKQRFICNPKRGHFVPLFQCRRDPRFIESHCADNPSSYTPEQEFGGPSCPIIPGSVAPRNIEKNIESLCGKMRGIQGHHNSCYLDATLFAMFTFTSVFDSLLFRPPPPGVDSPHYTQVQQVLREEIVNPLRANLFVRADRVMHLRHLLSELSDVSGLTTEEKDPEEFLTSLVAQILRAEPFLKLSSGQETYHYQLFVEKDEKLRLPSVQQLFEQSFFTSDIKLKEVPSCLIIQMPRFGKSYKMYPRILPSQLLDITDVLEHSPRQCTICGKLAEFECRKCFDHYQCDSGLQSIWYCRTCLEKTHAHEKRTDHETCWRQLSLPDYFLYDKECPVSRVFMELFAVVCIETSHYVAFVKGGSGCDAPWCFFDSMADRKGERNGYNIPEMVPCPDLAYWLSDEGSHQLNNITDDRQLPEYAKRLMCDAYMVMYQSPDLMMYR